MSKSAMKRVAVIPWEGMPDCYIVISGQKRRSELVGDKWYSDHGGHAEIENTWANKEFRTEACITFTYMKDGVAAEWDGEYGPIQLWFEAKVAGDGVREHWLWPLATGAGHWSQMAVNENDLPRSFNKGEWGSIFGVLRSFVDSNLRDKRDEETAA